MKTAGVIIVGSLLFASPISLNWSPASLPSMSIDRADARIGRPLTPLSVAGVNRRVHRRAYYRAATGYGYGRSGYRGYGGYGYGGYGGYRYGGYSYDPNYTAFSASTYSGYSEPYSSYSYGSYSPYTQGYYRGVIYVPYYLGYYSYMPGCGR